MGLVPLPWGSVGVWLWGRVAAGGWFPPFWLLGVQSDAPILLNSQPYSSLPSPQSPVPRGCSFGGHVARVGASKAHQSFATPPPASALPSPSQQVLLLGFIPFPTFCLIFLGLLIQLNGAQGSH